MSSNNLCQRVALAVAACVLAFVNAACTGGQGGSGGGNGSSSGGGSSSGATASFASFPSDFAMPYASPGVGIFLSPASNPAATAQVATGDVTDGMVVETGTFAAGSVTDSRPAVYAYAQANQWFRLDLRSGTSVAPVQFGGESQTVCPGGFFQSSPDHAVALHSYIFYITAGADGTCNNADDEFHALRLDDSTSTAPRNLGVNGALVERDFLNSDGSIAGWIIQVGSELRHYDAALANFTTLVTGINGFASAVTFARSEAVVYVKYQDTNLTAFLVKCNLDGSFSTLYSAADAKLGIATVDSSAIYIVRHSRGVSPSAPDVLMRVPFDSSQAATPIYTATAGSYIALPLGTTADTVVMSTYLNTGDGTLLAVSKTNAANPVTIATATNFNLGFNEFYGTFVTGDGRIVWTELNGNDVNGNPTSATAGISDEHGSILEQHSNSEWVAPAYGAVDFSVPAAPLVLGGVLVRSYTGNYSTDGHKGGTIAYYDFGAGSATDIASITDQARLVGGYTDGISALGYMVLGPTPNTDIAVTDLRSNRFTRVTNTPSISEVLQ